MEVSVVDTNLKKSLTSLFAKVVQITACPESFRPVTSGIT